MSEVQAVPTLESLAKELKDLRTEVEVYHRTAQRLDRHVEEFKNSNSSRRGLEGKSGPKGDPGRDAVIRIVQKNGDVLIENESGPVAQIITVPAPAGPAPTEAQIIDAVRTLFRGAVRSK